MCECEWLRRVCVWVCVCVCTCRCMHITAKKTLYNCALPSANFLLFILRKALCKQLQQTWIHTVARLTQNLYSSPGSLWICHLPTQYLPHRGYNHCQTWQNHDSKVIQNGKLYQCSNLGHCNPLHSCSHYLQRLSTADALLQRSDSPKFWLSFLQA